MGPSDPIPMSWVLSGILGCPLRFWGDGWDAHEFVGSGRVLPNPNEEAGAQRASVMQAGSTGCPGRWLGPWGAHGWLGAGRGPQIPSQSDGCWVGSLIHTPRQLGAGWVPPNPIPSSWVWDPAGILGCRLSPCGSCGILGAGSISKTHLREFGCWVGSLGAHWPLGGSRKPQTHPDAG